MMHSVHRHRAVVINIYHKHSARAGLTIWWALGTPQRRGPTWKVRRRRGREGGEGCPPQLGVWVALYKLLGGVRVKAPAENGFGEI